MIRRLSIRARLALGLLLVAALAVGVSTVLAERGLDPALSAAAARDVNQTAAHAATILSQRAAQHGGGIVAADVTSVEHLALIRGIVVTVRAPDGTPIGLDSADQAAHGRAASKGAPAYPVEVGGKVVGSVSAASLGGGHVLAAQPELRHSLWRLHLVAGGIALVAALVTALLLAWTLARPLHAIRLAADALSDGDVGTRVQPTGGPELVAVGTALNRLAETLQLEEAARRRNVADLAHELRTPVGGILSRIEAAQDGVLEDNAANLAAMHAEAVRLARFCDDVSRVAEAERPDLLLQHAKVDLLDLASTVAADAAVLAREHGLDLIVSGYPAFVVGDHDRLRQVMENLVANAIRYTDAGGRVELSVLRDGDSAMVVVKDSGIGISAADIPHVFTRFWRAERSRSRASGGSGVGLAIVRELAWAHGGSVAVESTPGSGSTFTVRLPSTTGGPRRTVLSDRVTRA